MAEGVTQVLRQGRPQRARPAFDSGRVNAGSRAGHRVAIARDPGRHSASVSCPDYRRQALGKGRRPVACRARLRLSLAPLPVAGVLVDRPSPGWLPQKANFWPLTHRHPPSPFPLIERQSLRSLKGVSAVLQI
jgi:hypothetical protein